jgi:hypothetical protein
VNFTREPIIETIISPKDGFKLLVRNTKGGNSEEYYIDALEVVSFGRAFFFRSQERPKPFLVPVSDYEVLEVKETRVALKNVSHERNIKIGGGREASVRYQPREPAAEEVEVEASAETAVVEEGASEAPLEPRIDNKRRDRRHRRRRRGPDQQEWTDRKPGQTGSFSREPEPSRPEAAVEGGGAQEETKVSSSMFTSLLPPPPNLISQTLSRQKDQEAAKGDLLPKPVEEKKPEPREEGYHLPPDDNSEPSSLHRATVTEGSTFSSTHFSPLIGSSGFDPYF